MKRLLFLILFSITQQSFAESQCGTDQLDPDDCSFYTYCVENKIGCGNKGYAISYGEYYCNRFKETFETYPNDFSKQAHNWRKATAVCLQKQLSGTIESLLSRPVQISKSSCKTIRKNAYAQHSSCYTQIENSICFLPPSDIASIIRHKIINFSDLLLSGPSIKQMNQVKEVCLKQLSVKSLRKHYDWWKDEFLK